jgi:6-phosphogluconolactonase
MNRKPEIRVFPDREQLFAAAAQQFADLAHDAIQQLGRFTVALSGGSTPQALYELLAQQFSTSIPWQNVFFFWGDERHVPPDHPESNYRMAHEAMLSKLPLPPENIFRIRGEEPNTDAAAEQYEQTLRRFFQLQRDEWPRFDLIHLGLGPDAHTASLFPGTAVLKERSRLVAANWVAKLRTYRLTLTLTVLNHARCVTFLVAGAEKAQPLHQVLEGQGSPDDYPAKLVSPSDGELVWMVDREAASMLSV